MLLCPEWLTKSGHTGTGKNTNIYRCTLFALFYFYLSMWNSSTLATSCEELTHWKRLWCWEGLGARGEGDDRGWDGWMASPIRWIWVWVNSGSWWWIGRPGVLRFMGSQRVRHDWATELNWTDVEVQGKNAEVVCHSLLQWTTFCQTSPPWPLHLGWPHTAWLSFIELDKLWSMWSDWLVVCDCGFSPSALWCPLSASTVLLGFLLPWTWGISSWLLEQSAAAAPYLGHGVWKGKKIGHWKMNSPDW